MDCYVLLVIIVLVMITIICYDYTKQRIGAPYNIKTENNELKKVSIENFSVIISMS